METRYNEILAAIDNAIFNMNDNTFSMEVKLMDIKNLLEANQKNEYLIIGLLAVTIIGIVTIVWNQRKIKKQLKRLLKDKEQDKP